MHAGANRTLPATGTCTNWTAAVDECPAYLVCVLVVIRLYLFVLPVTVCDCVCVVSDSVCSSVLQRLTPTVIGAAIALPSLFVLTVAGLWTARQCGWLQQDAEEDDEESRPAGRRAVGRRRVYKPARLLSLSAQPPPEKSLLDD